MTFLKTIFLSYIKDNICNNITYNILQAKNIYFQEKKKKKKIHRLSNVWFKMPIYKYFFARQIDSWKSGRIKWYVFTRERAESKHVNLKVIQRERERKKSKAGDRRKIESYWWKKTFELVLEIIKNHRHVLLVVAYPSNEISISNGRIFGERGDIFHTYRKKNL